MCLQLNTLLTCVSMLQSGDSFEFALRLCGQGPIWQDCAKYVIDEEQGLLQFPAKVPYCLVLGQHATLSMLRQCKAHCDLYHGLSDLIKQSQI